MEIIDVGHWHAFQQCSNGKVNATDYEQCGKNTSKLVGEMSSEAKPPALFGTESYF